MSYEDSKKSLQRQARESDPSSSPAAAPGKRTLTMGLGARPAGAGRSGAAPIQQRRNPGGDTARQERAAEADRLLEAAVRPDLQAPVQRKGAGSEGGQASAPSGSGQPLPGDVQAKMEGAFGADFSAVRVHEGPQADAMGALAYTQGTDIHFQPGQYDPQSQHGQELLGHELTHVVQQSQGRVPTPTQAKGAPINDDPSLEREADTMGARAAAGAHASMAPATDAAGAVQRKSGPIQAKIVKVLNFHRLADQIHEAVDGLGTDEEAVYSALSALDHKKENIDELRTVYQAKFGASLEADIRDDFSGSELAHALGLLQAREEAKPAGAGAGAGAGAADVDYDKLAAQIRAAVDGLGTDEEAVYSALSRLDSDPAKIAKLEEAYKNKYKVTLRSDLMGDFEGDERKHVLELLGDRSNGEKVDVANDEEAKKAAEIIREIYVEYGVDVNSQAGVDAIYKDYDQVPTSVRDMLKTKEWKYKELVALKAALARFAPILGAKRKDSTRSGDAQEIITVSKVDQAIDTNEDTGVLDTTTLGEYFESSKNFSMFKAGTNSTVDFSDNAKQLEGTAIHEIAHGLMKYCLPDYVATLKYWDSEYKASGEAGAEAPITDYGSTNAGEDLSEAVMYYFVDPNTLKNGQGGKVKGEIGNPCPERFAFIEKAVKDWQKEKETK
ncbi:MAG TPA: DUF4157 domain-containing protein [Haliangium sp.]|nr:DUF4157 domain-containing protein [Haliangium sp.]